MVNVLRNEGVNVSCFLSIDIGEFRTPIFPYEVLTRFCILMSGKLKLLFDYRCTVYSKGSW